MVAGVIFAKGAIKKTAPIESEPMVKTQPVAPTKEETPPVATDSGTSMTKSETIVTITDAGFVPATVTVKAGTKVTWQNKSTMTVSINSDPHPTHTLYPKLNLGTVAPGGSVSLVFDTPGTYTYHDHLQPSIVGKVVVQ